jgi:hypothetical protein
MQQRLGPPGGDGRPGQLGLKPAPLLRQRLPNALSAPIRPSPLLVWRAGGSSNQPCVDLCLIEWIYGPRPLTGKRLRLARFSSWPDAPGPFPVERSRHRYRTRDSAYHFFNRVAQCAVTVRSEGLQNFQADDEKKQKKADA